jgi:hypothetical protein
LNKLSVKNNPIYRVVFSVGMAALLHLAQGDVAAQGWWSLQPLANVHTIRDLLA